MFPVSCYHVLVSLVGVFLSCYFLLSSDSHLSMVPCFSFTSPCFVWFSSAVSPRCLHSSPITLLFGCFCSYPVHFSLSVMLYVFLLKTYGFCSWISVAYFHCGRQWCTGGSWKSCRPPAWRPPACLHRSLHRNLKHLQDGAMSHQCQGAFSRISTGYPKVAGALPRRPLLLVSGWLHGSEGTAFRFSLLSLFVLASLLSFPMFRRLQVLSRAHRGPHKRSGRSVGGAAGTLLPGVPAHVSQTGYAGFGLHADSGRLNPGSAWGIVGGRLGKGWACAWWHSRISYFFASN